MISARARVALRAVTEVVGAIDLGIAMGDLIFRRDRAASSATFPSPTPATSALFAGRPDRYAALPAEPRQEGDGSRRDRPVAQAAARRGDWQPITIWFIPWPAISLILIAVLLVAGILAATRDRRHLWLQHRREERAVIRDLRSYRLDAK